MNTTPLSDTQTVILAAACARDERRVFPVTARIKGGAVGNVCKSLLRRGLVEEIAATDLYTVWRHDEELGPVTLRATERAFQVLGIADGPKYDDIDPSAATVVQAPPAPTITKQDIVIGLLSRPKARPLSRSPSGRDGWNTRSAA